MGLGMQFLLLLSQMRALRDLVSRPREKGTWRVAHAPYCSPQPPLGRTCRRLHVAVEGNGEGGVSPGEGKGWIMETLGVAYCSEEEVAEQVV